MSACAVCKHPEHPLINQQLEMGIGFAALSARFDLNSDVLRRHKNEHTNALSIQGTDPQELLANLKAALASAQAVALTADEDKIKLDALREVRQATEAIAKLTGAYRQPEQKHLLPFWNKIKGAILKALKNHPEARTSVLSAIEELQAGGE